MKTSMNIDKNNILTIGKKKIGDGYSTFIIAEAGVNHNGSLDMATKLVDAAVKAKADCVKFQTFQPDKVAVSSAPKAEYQKSTTDAHESQLDMIKKIFMSYKDFEYLFEYTKEKNIIFMSSPFDVESAKFLAGLGVPAFKIPSGEIVNPRILKVVASSHKPVIMSTGMANLGDIEYGISQLKNGGTTEIALLHCFTSYPAPYEKINLRSILTLKQAFNMPIGYSDHTLGVHAPLVAIALGATLIEKHFTLDKNLPGPDHKASLNPDELSEMVRLIRETELALGDGRKEPALEELEISKIARRSIVSAKFIPKDKIIQYDDIEFKRPAVGGIDPRNENLVIGRRAKSDIQPDKIISWSDLLS